MAFVVVALDGPTGVGKSTLARQLAERNQLLYVNTGSMYRCLAWKWKSLDKPESEEMLKELGEQAQIVLEADGQVLCDGEEISSAIRTEEISVLASQVSRFAPIRQALKFQQRQLVEQAKIRGIYQGAVLEGRDIGTIVLPQADCKFFVEASSEIRAHRRFAELQAKDPSARFEKVLEALRQRDEQDRNRSEAPLRKADDAILVDTSELNVEQLLSVLELHLRPFLLTESS
jgi:cytidylate kinase